MLAKRLMNSAVAATISVALWGCGGTGQDDGRSYNIQTPLSGRVIDGHVARATVFVDTNNNGTRDAWEPSAFTDNAGYFSYNPLTDTNYCAVGASLAQHQYCLVLNTGITPVIVRVDNGYDLSTGEPFIGQMARKVSITGTGATDLLVSPLTTLVTLLESSDDQARILAALGLTEDALDVDYLAEAGLDTTLFNLALKIHKVVSVLADVLVDSYDEIGDNLGTPNDATQAVYRSLTARILGGDVSLDALLASDGLLNQVVRDAEDELRRIYVRRELTLPAAEGALDFSRAVQVVSQLAQAVDVVIPPTANSVDSAEVTGAARVLEALVIKALRENGGVDSTLDMAFGFIDNAVNLDLVAALRQSASAENAFVSGLVSNDFSGSDFDSVEDYDAALQLPEGAQALSLLAGKRVKLSDPDLGSAPNDLKDIEVLFYLAGEQTATEGELIACAKYIDGASSNGSLGEGNTPGTLVEGFWSLLNADSDGSSYSVLFTLTFLGTTYQTIIKPAGNVLVDGVRRPALRFDFGGDIRDWHTENGFEAYVDLPLSSAECEQRLPSRIGL